MRIRYARTPDGCLSNLIRRIALLIIITCTVSILHFFLLLLLQELFYATIPPSELLEGKNIDLPPQYRMLSYKNTSSRSKLEVRVERWGYSSRCRMESVRVEEEQMGMPSYDCCMTSSYDGGASPSSLSCPATSRSN